MVASPYDRKWRSFFYRSQYIGKLENVRVNSDYSDKHAGKPMILLAVFLPVGIQGRPNMLLRRVKQLEGRPSVRPRFVGIDD